VLLQNAITALTGPAPGRSSCDRSVAVVAAGLAVVVHRRSPRYAPRVTGVGEEIQMTELIHREKLILTHAQAIGIAQRRLGAILSVGVVETEALTMVAEIEEALGKIEALLDPKD
jgi:hypothetical protein